MHADRRVAGAGAAGDRADARPAAQLAGRLGHHRRTVLVPAGDDADATLQVVKRVEQTQEAFPRHAVEAVDAVCDQRVRQQPAPARLITPRLM